MEIHSDGNPQKPILSRAQAYMMVYILGHQKQILDEYYTGRNQPAKSMSEPDNVAYYGWGQSLCALERTEGTINREDVLDTIISACKYIRNFTEYSDLLPLEMPRSFDQLTQNEQESLRDFFNTSCQ